MSSEATYTVEPAKSGRAKCKKCKETIEKGMIKIIVAYPPKDDAGYGISSSYHLGCFKSKLICPHFFIKIVSICFRATAKSILCRNTL